MTDKEQDDEETAEDMIESDKEDLDEVFGYGNDPITDYMDYTGAR